jgi:hypothetical protein
VGQSDFLEGQNQASFLSRLRGAKGLQQAHPDRETPMQVLCMQKKDSSMPLCNMHNVALKQQQIAIDSNAPSLGRITCYVCPISRSVVRELRGNYAYKG